MRLDPALLDGQTFTFVDKPLNEEESVLASGSLTYWGIMEFYRQFQEKYGHSYIDVNAKLWYETQEQRSLKIAITREPNNQVTLTLSIGTFAPSSSTASTE